MKKSIFFALLLVILLTGCGEKKLICNYSSTDSFQGSTKVNYKATFSKKDKLEVLSVSTEKQYNDSYLKLVTDINLDDELTSASSVCTELEGKKAVKCNATKNGNKIKLNVKYNVNKLNDTEKEELGFTEMSSYNYEELKTLYEQNGFTCK